MCFSPQASFMTGSLLVLTGLASIRLVRKARQPELLPLALTPVLFGIQQLLEGALWLGLLATPRNETLYALGLHGFIWIALFLWPWWLPFALARAEVNALRQRIMTLLSLCGFALGLYLIWPPYSAQILGNHIAYTISHAALLPFLLYLVTGVVPFFISSLAFMWIPGSLILAGLAVTIYVYFTWTTSIWCFFAALTSAYVYGRIRTLTTKEE